MTTETAKPQLPQGVGRSTPGWLAFMVISLLVLGFGIFAFVREQTEGMVSTGMRDVGTMGGAAWGLYVVLVVYFIGVSFAGITVAALIRLFNIERLKPLARSAELLTVVSLILGAFAIIVDLGQPLRGLVNLFRYARPQSPFFGTFALVLAGYLFASLVYLYLGGRSDAARLAKMPGRLQGFHRWWAAGYRGTEPERRRHMVASFWLALAIIPLLIVATSTLGLVFGLQVGRPGWFGTLQAPAFVALAGVSGVGLLIVIAAVFRRVTHTRHRVSDGAFTWLGKLLMGLLAVYVYFMVVELVPLIYAGDATEQRLSEALLTGEYAWIYWTSVTLMVVPLLALLWQAAARRWSVGWLVAAGVLVNLAALGKRYLIVVPSQTHGNLLPYEVGSYAPTWVEYGVALGLVALGALLFGLFMKVFPIMEVLEDVPEEGSPTEEVMVGA